MGTFLPPVHMSKRYHRSKFPLTLRTLEAFLRDYEATPHDEGLEDPITWCNQGEYFLEAKSLLHVGQFHCIQDIMKQVPVMCRTITLKKPLFPGLKMNPWLGCVHTLPTIVKHVSTADFLRFKDKVHDKELINCAMLVTKNPSGSILSHGVGKHMSSFLISGDPELYHPDADLATWAMVVFHILTQPSRATWMLEELAQIDTMHAAVYGEPKSSWGQYMATVASEDYGLALVTQSSKLPPWCRCPHINKFLLATFLLRHKLDAAQMELRRDAAVREFFGRIYNVNQVPYFFEGNYDVTVEQVLSTIQFSLKPTLRDTIRDFHLKAERLDLWSIPFTIREPTQDIVRAAHMNLSCAEIVHFFKSMCPEIQDLSDATWRRLFVTGMCVQDSYKRSTGEEFVLTEQKIRKFIRDKLKRDILWKVPNYVLTRYQSIMLVGHAEFPVIISEENAAKFKEKHGRDLREEFDVTEYGLSRIACMCPQCPFFKKELGKRCGSMVPQLQDHVSSGINGFHRTVINNTSKSDFDLLADLLKNSLLFRLGENQVKEAVNNINAIKAPVPWEQFERHFL